jgi:hypothetical protein
MKNFGLWTFITAFIIIGLANLPMVQGMPLSMQLSFIANEALWYMQQAAEPVMDLLRQYAQ